jgi:hypothetical protein
VTSVTRRYSADVSRATGAKTVTIALFTQTSIGPSSSSTRSAAASTALSSATSRGRTSARARRLDLVRGGLQSLLPARDEPEGGALGGEAPHGGAADARRRTRDDDDAHRKNLPRTGALVTALPS